MSIKSIFFTKLIYKKVAGSPDYKPNQGNLTKMSTGRRIGEVNFYFFILSPFPKKSPQPFHSSL